ncbi:MAG: hypothetical protein JJU12_06790 [Chlamydiales bacterium]|nr:hypothetical protein [Chlamydiales bacterium]
MAEVYIACRPTWLEGTKKVWQHLSGEIDCTNKLLRWVQEVKEELIIEEVQINRDHNHWHGLTYARKHCGEKYGLDLTHQPTSADPHFENSPFYSPGQVDDLFNFSYSESRLVRGVMTLMHMQMEGYSDYERSGFVDALRLAVKDSDYDIMGEFFETYQAVDQSGIVFHQYRINSKGVMVLLMVIGQLK